jgi:ribosomal 50S subunit-recycling heat shock protein
MSFATAIGEMIESGKVTVSANNVKAIEIKTADKKIEINAIDKEIIKKVLTATRGERKSKGLLESISDTIGQIKIAQIKLGELKGVAEELSEAGITVTLSYEGNVVITLGSQAKPKLSSGATGTKAIEINSPRKLIELLI